MGVKMPIIIAIFLSVVFSALGVKPLLGAGMKK